jgi:hypothetical protein
MEVNPMNDGRTPGFTVADIAARYRVGQDKVRGWIKRGELAAVNTSAALCGRPRDVVTPEALAKFTVTRWHAKPGPRRVGIWTPTSNKVRLGQPSLTNPSLGHRQWKEKARA